MKNDCNVRNILMKIKDMFCREGALINSYKCTCELETGFTMYVYYYGK